MARQALIEKAKNTQRFLVRRYTRCFKCGRSRSVWRKFLLCRMHLREFIEQGKIPGFRKMSW